MRPTHGAHPAPSSSFGEIWIVSSISTSSARILRKEFFKPTHSLASSFRIYLSQGGRQNPNVPRSMVPICSPNFSPLRRRKFERSPFTDSQYPRFFDHPFGAQPSHTLRCTNNRGGTNINPASLTWTKFSTFSRLHPIRSKL
jgi:hypothetical protein